MVAFDNLKSTNMMMMMMMMMLSEPVLFTGM